jgi:tetratricopeptide (TPR) repeat protein
MPKIYIDSTLVECSKDDINKLFIEGKLYQTNDEYTFFNLGVYYNIQENYDEMKKYYLMSIILNNSDAMFNLGLHYDAIEENYDLAKKYYLMATELGNSNAMNNLAHYYRYVEENYDLTKKYFLMSINLNNSNAMNNLGYYYYDIEENYDLAKKYYLMAIKLDNAEAMNNLGFYYYNIVKNYDLAKEYILMAIKLGESNAKQNIKLITTPIERYILLNNNGIEFNEEITRDIHIYVNKLKLSKVDKCGICLEEDKTVILLNCFFHYCCQSCYVKVYNEPCPFCRL